MKVVSLLPTLLYCEDWKECGSKNPLANLDCGSRHRAGRRTASGEAVFMVPARCVGGFGKWSVEFMALESDTINTAAGFGSGAVLDWHCATWVCGANRRYVSCSYDAVPVLRRGHIFYFGELFKEERASDEGKQRLSDSDGTVPLRKHSNGKASDRK
jgi:hypothetical protein